QEVFGTNFLVIGAAGADNFKFEKSLQYHGGQVFEDALSGVLFVGGATLGLGSRHGWFPLGRSRQVTRATGNRIQELDHRPAISVYEDYFGTGFYADGEPLARRSLFYPLGFRTQTEGWLIRQPLRVGDEGSLVCNAEIPEGEEVRLMIGLKEALLEATREAGKAALSGLGGKKPRIVFIFESASRKKILGRDALQELQIIRELFGGEVPVAGCYSYGELSPLESERYLGQSRFLNEAIVIAALGD
ncbi:MAG: FIST C-terminal domain-containing protein, partial [Candidatus Omnitrophota bacterium]